MNTLERVCWSVVVASLGCALCSTSFADGARARALGIPFDGTPGRFNAITDVEGVTVGYSTLIEGEGEHAVRTGVTAILPRGPATTDKPVFAGVFSLNGNGEMTGTHWIEESGFLEGPVLITNTHSVGVVRDAAIAVAHPSGRRGRFRLLVVAAGRRRDLGRSTLNDINGFHVKPEHVFAALESAHGGAIAEGNVGGGTGMICHEFKCGTGTSSRVVKIDEREYRVGVLVQANYGVRGELRIAGVPVGKVLQNDLLWPEPKDDGSIIIVIATDAPLLPHQLKRLARRASLGLARNGSYSGNGSGDIFIAFSTANEAASQVAMTSLTALGNEQLDPLFLATVQAVEESIINAMIAAEPMTGYQGHKAAAIDHQALIKLLKEHKAVLEKKTAR